MKDKQVISLEWEIMDASRAQVRDQSREDENARARLKRHLTHTEKHFRNYDP